MAVSLNEQMAIWAAEDEALRAAGKAQAEYLALISELEALERKIAGPGGVVVSGIYLTDTNIDEENVPAEIERGSLEYWQAMYRSAACSAGGRGEEAGLDVNKLLGRAIY